ncbi:glycosyltransferase family 2 protein [Orrella daihaiensis]|uniref:Glycosyltransferase family 2 protein n=1 Tax=Orrella daihaiensis TaxID=2782176 RepID=A0ABY4AMC7_9BURK|nr:glycosyltransferase family 2 protein [Orrella daihaiensis]UOD51432.1 glycosyltransferase family 2 protein [Orrella daihaiensis]
MSFVIPLYNHLAESKKMLSSLQASLPDSLSYEIILADDASTDGTGAWLDSLNDPRVKVLKHETNLGFAANNNAAVRLADGAVLGLLNSDLIFSGGWFEQMLAVLESASLNSGLVGNVQRRVSDGSIDHVGVTISPEAQFSHSHEIPDLHTHHRKVVGVTGACVLTRKADFEAVGGFDETFLNGAEDIDLCYKLRAMGKSINVATQSVVQHHVSLSRKRNTDQDIRNSRHLFSKWGKEIRRDLADVWRRLLAENARGYRKYIAGDFSSELLESPNLLANLIAKMMIDREQAEWARRLQDSSDASPQPVAVTWRGLSYDTNLKQYVLEGEAEFFVRVDYASNFYICGAAVDVTAPNAQIEITVNGMQVLTVTFDRLKEVNAGIVGPLMLPSIQNVFRVRTTKPLILTHIVISDQRVDL